MYVMMNTIMCLALLPGFGGVLASPVWGWAAFFVPVMFFLGCFVCARIFTFSLEDAHPEVVKLISKTEPPADKWV